MYVTIFFSSSQINLIHGTLVHSWKTNKTVQHYNYIYYSIITNMLMWITCFFNIFYVIESLAPIQKFVTLPPHSYYKFQFLDLWVCTPFKTFCNATIDTWMHRNRLYHIPDCRKVGKTHKNSALSHCVLSMV